MMRDFLRLEVPVLGALQRWDRIHAAVTKRHPFVGERDLPEAKLLLQIAEQCLQVRDTSNVARSVSSCERTQAIERPPGIELRGDAARVADDMIPLRCQTRS